MYVLLLKCDIWSSENQSHKLILKGGFHFNQGAAKPSPSKPGAARPSSSKGSSHKCETSDRPASASKNRPASAAKSGVTESVAPASTNAPINKKTYHARLGLARALAKKSEDRDEAHKYYNEVID